MSISWRRSAVVAVVAIAGCLHLGATRLDTDGDGVDDALDNCPVDYNPDQAATACNCPSELQIHRDLDGDGVDDGCDQCIGPGPTGADTDGDGIDDGCDPCVNDVSTIAADDDRDGILDGCDACVGFIGVDIDQDGLDDSCDACLAGPPDDQDGDGVEDGCDPCPAISATTNASTTDDDLLGDACDPWPTTNDDRLVFDGFRVEDPDTWLLQGGTTAVVATDRLTLGDPVKPGAPAIYGTRLASATGTFQAMVRVHVPGDTDASSAGIALLDGQGNWVTCSISTSGTGYIRTYFDAAAKEVSFAPVTTPPVAASDVTLALAVDALAHVLRCEVRSEADPAQTQFAGTVPLLGGPWYFGPVTFAGGAVFDWFEMLERQQSATPL